MQALDDSLGRQEELVAYIEKKKKKKKLVSLSFIRLLELETQAIKSCAFFT